MSHLPHSALSWLSGFSTSDLSTSGWTPTDPPGSRQTHTDPPGSRSGPWTPTDPPGARKSWTHTDPPGSPRPPSAQSWPQPSPAPVPRTGIDPAWTYMNSGTLLGQALRKSRAKIVRPSDQLLNPLDEQAAVQRGKAVKGSHLWRWAPEFRVAAVTHDLISRFQVHDRTLWLLNPQPGQQGLRIKATPVFALPDPVLLLDIPEQVDKVLRAATEREDRLPEILSQASDFWPFFESITGVRLQAAPRMAELLDVANGWTLHLLMALKHQVAALRPVQCSSLVMPVIPTPGHGAVPSGHATVAAFMSELLHTLMPHQAGSQRPEQLDRLARRIAFNRVVAGVHFQADSQAGYALGTQLARLMRTMAGHPGGPPRALDAAEVLAPPYELPELGARPAFTAGDYAVRTVPTLRDLWQQAQAELAEQRV